MKAISSQQKQLSTKRPKKKDKAVSNPVGRPLAFKSVQELREKIGEYFDWCDNRTKTIFVEKTNSNVAIAWPAPYTMSGLARRLGIDRRTLIDYAHRDEFLPAIREARERIHEDVESRMMETRNEKGAMFSLRNNFGWKEKVEEGGGNTVVVVGFNFHPAKIENAEIDTQS